MGKISSTLSLCLLLAFPVTRRLDERDGGRDQRLKRFQGLCPKGSHFQTSMGKKLTSNSCLKTASSSASLFPWVWSEALGSAVVQLSD